MKDVFVWLESLFALCFKFHLHISIQCRDVYRIESIISVSWYWYLSKWQINDTFNDTFYYDINKDRASLTKKMNDFLFIKCMFCFYIFTSFGKWWSLNTIILYAEYTKRKKVNFLMVRYHIVSVWFCQYQYCIVRKKNKKVHIPNSVILLSPMATTIMVFLLAHKQFMIFWNIYGCKVVLDVFKKLCHSRGNSRAMFWN